MNTLGEALLVNAVLAGLLAVVVGIVTRWVKRPEIAYWLWLIVLAKLVTPPLLSLPIPAGHAKQTVSAVLQPTVVLPPSENTSQTGPTVLGSKPREIGLRANHITPSSPPSSTGPGPAVDVHGTPSHTEPRMPMPAPVVTQQPPSPLDRISWIYVLLCVALSGSLCWFSLATVRLVRFSRMIRHSEEVPADLQTIARQMSDRMGIRHCPELRMLQAHIPPLLWWSNWRPLIVLPSDLLDQVESNKQAAMIAHELAHYHRGDHLVRWLAMMILGFYWWHPGVWWAQRRLQQIEEECCDAWVVWALPGQARNYADLLLDTVEFLGSPSGLPLAVHGLGQVGQLTRRVELILMGTARQQMSWMGLVMLVAFAGLTLPWSVQAFSGQELAIEKGRERVPQDVSNQSLEMAANHPVDRRFRGPDGVAVLDAGADVVRRRAEPVPGTVYLGQARKWQTETEELPVIHRHLARELVRQAFLLAARDGLGLATADAWLGDVMPDSGIFDMAATPGDPFLLEISRGGETTRLEFVGRRRRRASPTDYGAWTKEAEVLSRTKFPEVLKKAGFRGRSKVRRGNAEAPASVERLLGEMNFVAQFRALRELNALLRSAGESPALLGALVRGYANLGVMTEYYWHPAHKVFKARALLYAQRMVAQDENAPIAKWHRAYAAALAGLHAWALADLDTAGKSAADPAGKNRAMAPAWAQLIGPFCRYEVEAIGKHTKDPKIGQLAALLKYLAVEQAGGQPWIVQTATSVLPVIPECYRVHDGLADFGGVSVEDSVTAAPIRLAGETLYARLKSMPGLPTEAKRIVDARATKDIWQSIIEKALLSNAAGEYEARHRLVEALLKRDEPVAGSGVGEPSWSALGLMLREMSFMQVYRRTGFVRFNYPGSCEQWLSDSASLVRGHPCEALLGTFSMDINKVQDAARRMARFDLAGGDYPPRHFGAVLLSRDGKFTTSSMLERPSWNRDDVVRDFITYIRWYTDSRADPGKQTLDTLLKISPYCPLARAQLVVFHWNEVQERVARWDKESAVYPGLSVALAMRYMGLGRWDDTQRCLKAAIRIVPCDLMLYRQLAAVYKRQGQTDRWLATLEEGLTQHAFGLGRSDVQSEIAYHYMYKKQWEKALPYAEGAAASGSSSGLVCAAECNEALQRWTEAEKHWRTSTERYMGFFMNWYAFCRRTGKGNVMRARAIAQNIVDRLAANAYIPNSCGVDRWDAILFYLLEDRPANALAEIERVVEQKPDADDVLCMAVIADRLKNTKKRDEALNRAKLLSGHDGNDPDPRPNGIVTLAEAFAKDLAGGGKGKMDFAALDKADRALSGSERFSFDALLAQYLGFHGQPEAAQRYALRCMGWPKMGVRYRTLAGAMLVRQKVDPASYRALVMPEPGKDSHQPAESPSGQSDLSWTPRTRPFFSSALLQSGDRPHRTPSRCLGHTRRQRCAARFLAVGL